MRDTFRQDLHQILAYSSFNPSKDKISLLVYPFSNDNSKSMKDNTIKLESVNPLANVRNKIFLIGIPILTTGIDKIVNQIANILSNPEAYQY